MRKLRRAVAKTNMRLCGLRQICKGDFFAKHWREYAVPIQYPKKPKRRRRARA